MWELNSVADVHKKECVLACNSGPQRKKRYPLETLNAQTCGSGYAGEKQENGEKRTKKMRKGRKKRRKRDDLEEECRS
jgi:hypothetical protein